MNLTDIIIQIRNLFVGILSVFGLSQSLTVSLANFSLAAIGIVLLVVFPQITILILVVLFLLFGLHH